MCSVILFLFSLLLHADKHHIHQSCHFHPFFWTWTIVQNTFCSHCAWWLPLVNEGFVTNSSGGFSIHFFGLGVTNKAAKPNCILPIGDDGSLYNDCSSGKLIFMIINETQLSWRQQSCQKCEHQQSHFDFLKNDYSVSLFKRNNLLAKICFS